MPGVSRGFTPVCCVVAVLLIYPFDAHAYIGPGAGLSAIGSLVALVAAVFIGILGFVWFPIKRLMRRMKSPSSQGAKRSAGVSADMPPKEPTEHENDQGT